MKNNYYNIPLDFHDLFPKETEEGHNTPQTRLEIKKNHSLKNSVDDFIELIITTHLGEYKHNKGFGFQIWDLEFESIQIEKFRHHGGVLCGCTFEEHLMPRWRLGKPVMVALVGIELTPTRGELV